MLHIQVILYNSTKFLDKFIKGFNTISREKEFTIHFLENSDENSLDFLKSQEINFNYTYDNEKTNFGFGKGHNFLFNKYKSEYKDYFLILNPDTLPFFNFIDEFNLFLADKVKENWGIIELSQFPNEHPKDFDQEYKTEWASGAVTIFKIKAFEEVKGFDENIFMYCEDVDISWGIREKGYEIYHCPKSKAAHITQDLDEEKDNTFERIQTFGGNLYLRYKYFGDEEVEKYKREIQGSGNDFIEAVKIFEDLKSKLKDLELQIFRRFKSPKLYSDTNYAKHRW